MFGHHYVNLLHNLLLRREGRGPKPEARALFSFGFGKFGGFKDSYNSSWRSSKESPTTSRSSSSETRHGVDRMFSYESWWKPEHRPEERG